MTSLRDEDIIRYQRQLILFDWDEKVQENLKNTHIALIGLGGLGSALLPYIARCGIEEMTFYDGDLVEIHNLHRQVIYTEHDCGAPKAAQAYAYMQKYHPHIRTHMIDKHIDEKNAHAMHKSDIIIDCTDSPSSRQLMNNLSLKAQIPLLSVSAIRYEGQMLWLNNDENAPCYHCIFDREAFCKTPTSRCDEMGVSPSIIMLMASLAMEHITAFCGKKNSIAPFMLLADCQHYSVEKIHISSKKYCATCLEHKNTL